MKKKTKETILQAYNQYHNKDFLSTDPLSVVHRFKNREDLEIVAIIAAVLSYGRVQLIIRAIEEILIICDNTPKSYAFETSFEEKREHFSSFKYRFNSGDDIATLIEVYREMIQRHGSFNTALVNYRKNCKSSLKEILHLFSSEIHTIAQKVNPELNKSFLTLFPTPKSGSACKRLCMLFRWMVRDNDGIDLGLWDSIPSSALIIPLDTHIATVARELALTTRKSPDWKCAEEITTQLRSLDRTDPVKYDFALCRVGMLRDR